MTISTASLETLVEGSDAHSVFRKAGTEWLNPVQLSGTAVANLATSMPTLDAVYDIMCHLTEDDYLSYLKDYYRIGREKFGHHWHYADLLTFLHAAATLLQPRNYLEIGVRRGRSLAVVANAAKTCRIYGFDMWMQDYAGMPNPGPEFVESEIKRLGYQQELTLISGDSHETVPAFFSENPNTTFDLINVDGDHTDAGARADLETVIPRLALGGVILLDDIVHPQHRYLETIWDELIGRNDRFSSVKYRDLGYGVAAAVRRA